MKHQRTLLISGASRGIGNAIARNALASGHRISLGIRNMEDFDNSIFRESEQVHLYPYEATDIKNPEGWVMAAAHRFGGFDGLIHCAGQFSRVGLLYSQGQEEEIQSLWQVNVMGPWRLTRAAWRFLEQSGDGRIITLVSMSGKRVKGNLAAYPATKFALMALCQSMRNQGWNSGIRITAICPSWVNTDMASEVRSIAREQMTQPEDIAELVVTLLRLPASGVPFEIPVSCQLEM